VDLQNVNVVGPQALEGCLYVVEYRLAREPCISLVSQV
jgi:hypothetical protein